MVIYQPVLVTFMIATYFAQMIIFYRGIIKEPHSGIPSFIAILCLPFLPVVEKKQDTVGRGV